MATALRRITRALLSVSDKTGLIDFTTALAGYGVELISTGGTAKALKEAGLSVVDVADLTKFPEMMDGRVKTLHPKVHGGLLAVRANKEHTAAMVTHGIEPIDLAVVNLYPFEATVAKGASFNDCIEDIDIGGPAMIRAAAKNHTDVAVVVEPSDYKKMLEELVQYDGMTSLELRRRLAAKAYARTAAYDSAISNWFVDMLGDDVPDYRTFGGRIIQSLRYGENPHQSSAFYRSPNERFGVATARQIQGKDLSYNNINDTDAAYECVAEFDASRTAACVIVKHANPCGVAEGVNLLEAYRKALAYDSTSAFGGIVALNRKLDAQTAKAITEIFTEVIIVPDATDEAIKIVADKKNLRLLLAGGLPDPRAHGLTVKSVAGGLLVQSRDNAVVDDMPLDVVTKRAPTKNERSDLCFAFRVAKHVKSNTIVYAKNLATVGIGAGQMSRIDAARIAAHKAAEIARDLNLSEPPTKGSVVASDAFFPFPDGLLAAIEAGATAVIQPGGSVNDKKVIAAADEHKVAMVFTGLRHFRH
jgi:phosphoribosylaminoimidazolecarboxamide formyltransferase / IMP cyclohydrolase